MTGVVLCGGQSSRMGRDKGLLIHQSATWAQLAADKLASLEIEVMVSVNESQYPVYSQLFQNAIVVVDDAMLQVGGPLKGLLSVHSQCPEEDLLVLACDMRDMQADVMIHLCATYTSTNAEAIVFRNNTNIEPLCGIYTAKGLHKLYEQYKHVLLEKFSMHYILQLLHTVYVPVPEQWQNRFRNYNSETDLEVL